MKREMSQLMERHAENYDMARLLASASKHSSDWLDAIPISSCGLRLDDEVIRIAVRLRLGFDICVPHTYVCGAMVDVIRSHALSCKRSSPRLFHYNHLNDIKHLSLTQAGSLATKEPADLDRTDEK